MLVSQRHLIKLFCGKGTPSFYCLLHLAFCPQLFSQPCPVTWGPTLQISNTPSSAFSPKLAVVGDTVHVVYHAGDLYYRRSADGGKTWDEESILVSDDSIGGQVFNHPFAATGDNVYFVWGNSTPSGGVSSIKIRRSTNGGTTWLDPQVITQQDPLRGYFSPMVAAYEESVYVAISGFVSGRTQVFFSRSSASGATWDSVRQITSGFSHGLADLAAKRGALHLAVAWSQINWGQEVAHMMSSDGGWTWSAEQQLSTIDSLSSWEPNIVADDAGNVYVPWQDAKYGSIGGFAGTVLLRKSTDYGQTWLPETEVSPLPSARASSLSIDSGSVHVVWDDERNGFEDGTIQYCASTDEGKTWCSEMTLGGPLRRALNAAIASVSQHLYAVWSSDRSVPGDTAQVFVRGGDIITNAAETHNTFPGSFTVLPLYPNPFNPVTTLEYSIPSRGRVAISVFDNLGRTVSKLFDGSQVAGSYRITLYGSKWASGVYYVVVRHNNTQVIRGIVFVR